MKTIRRKEIEVLIEHIDNKEIKDKLRNLLKDNFDEIDTETFFEQIKKLNIIKDNDYNLFLLLEEFYLRFKDVEG